MPGLTSAGGALALLHDDDQQLQEFGIEKLLELVDDFWAEIADDIATIEELYENEMFPKRDKAALLAAKVYYHLGAMADSLRFAMHAGKAFDLSEQSLFVNTLISEAIDTYSSLRQAGRAEEVPAALETTVDRMFDQCIKDDNIREAVGVALEARRIDTIQQALAAANNAPDVLEYTFNAVMTLVTSRAFRDEVLEILADVYSNVAKPDYVELCRCHVALGQADRLASLLHTLVGRGGDDRLIAFQLCFELNKGARQNFVQQVRAALSAAVNGGAETTAMDQSADTGDKDIAAAVKRMDSILSGDITLTLHVDFLSRNNHSDLLLLKNLKDQTPNSMICHSAVVLAHMLMSAGTTSDVFLRENKDWLMKAQNWAKFSAVSGLGVIHKGHTHQARKVLEPYLPRDDGSGSPYEISGGLYAFGLLHAGHGQAVLADMTQYLVGASTEVVQHGAALGLGLAALGCQDNDAQMALQNTLAMDSAVAGEAAGIAMGLNMIGTGDHDSINHMFNYAEATEHEKIIRGLALGMAFIQQGRREQADDMIATLLKHTDPLLRAGGCHMLATAYAGTDDNNVTKRLLHIAVSDASNDVRRAAAVAIGFVMIRSPEKVPTLLALLCESFNPHVRGGCCLALGVACAGTGLVSALNLIEPMFKDATPFVRQCAYVATGMILIQAQNTHPKVASFKKEVDEVASQAHQPILARFGAVLAMGIMYAGGQNTTIQPCRDHGHIDDQSIVGLLVFTQFWFWFPFTHFLSLALTPTALICLNGDLKMPQIDILSAVEPSKYAYFPMTEPPKEKSKDKVATAVLSITDKANRLQKNKRQEAEKMDTKPEGESEKEDKKEGEDEKPVAAEPEPKEELLSNPARVVAAQLPVVSIPDGCRYRPVLLPLRGDVTVLSDTTPGEEEIILETSEPGVEQAGGVSTANEPAPPAPFEFDESKED
ncbi:uncharacterized protein MONBRDRAFT_32955 [Monosiga brevicollis MX1]|uniref:26S proteasome regulatory subunit RPN2 C-terminal domain-containing protein n=1 Tax=Monosiga brevicollis TaxID=81824 RepID=A9V2Q5_MONBE|nr:uncharacterized protein MONBRDRAFT_32955 [Monosiga brevicollis MX1]EDQ88303.1 predicted protein [Monosiga brevicollis MX1]|eukprot:XP_001746896.1 hypothetical protein [Monosiga brevicollis MX1]